MCRMFTVGARPTDCGRPGQPEGAGGAALIGCFYILAESSGDKDPPNATMLSYFTWTP